MLICVKKNIFLTSRILNTISPSSQSSLSEFIALIYSNLTQENINTFRFSSLKEVQKIRKLFDFSIEIVKNKGLKSGFFPDSNPLNGRI